MWPRNICPANQHRHSMDDHLPPAGPYEAADNVGEGGREGVTHLCASYIGTSSNPWIWIAVLGLPVLPVLYPVPKAYLHMCRPIWVSELGFRQPKLFPCLLIPHVFVIHSDVVIRSFVHLFVHSEDLHSAPSTRLLFIHTENLHSTPSVNYYSFSHSGDLKYYIAPW